MVNARLTCIEQIARFARNLLQRLAQSRRIFLADADALIERWRGGRQINCNAHHHRRCNCKRNRRLPRNFNSTWRR